MYNHIDGGFLGKKVRNEKYSKKKLAEPQDETQMQEIMKAEENSFQKLKEMVVSEMNSETVSFLLRNSIRYRTQIMLDKNSDVLVNFPYLFTNAELVKKSLYIFLQFVYN